MRLTTFLLFVFLTFAAFNLTQAQTLTCTERLGEAQVAYDEGRIHDLVEDYRSTWGICLEESSDFTKEERVQAYRLLTLTYLQLDEPDKADEYMLKLLETEPEYIINTSVDPTEFINLYRTFRTDPIFRIGLRGGLNSTFQHMQTRQNLSAYQEIPLKTKLTTGFQVGASIEFDLFKNRPYLENLIFNPELSYFNRKTTEIYEDDFWSGSFLNQYNSLQLNALLHYNLIWEKSIRFHATFGLSGDYRFSVTQRVNGKLVDDSNQGESIESPILTETDAFSPFDLGLVVGGALRLKVGRPWASLDVRYHYGLFQLVQDRYAFYQNYITYGGGAKNNQRFQNIVINAGIHFPIFRHEKLILDK